ncbi:RagB/SusD family nutrient uptake outer membrane protein [Hymenobacter sp. NBH84]|uniref:RagB/SusD family nutrient uptake outer membrane protein n=1 Tax=Hymenobacter sp. NBH84 TaxID=2596915 RepID=UPI001626E04D|nr:RagB/SusD family nutrient uptake outer membrane protein [Hymenobacter sp. NBH84]QNE38818.1 RagB/SusD family nutrient uptake outer membrane protein [Hymenobacter sp. NBH84]
MKRYPLHIAALVGGLLLTTGCEKDLLDQTNPNETVTELFWRNDNDAVKGINAAYSGLQQLGTYRRWLNFAYDLRSDEGLSNSPWGELSNFTKFIITNYNFEVNQNIWRDHYRAIWRTNQVLANVPNIEMDARLKRRVVAEAHFLRALFYFNLASLYGNVPLVLEPIDPPALSGQATEAQVWEQVYTDLQEAIGSDSAPNLYDTYAGNDLGRATVGAARTLLAKAYMQNGRWADASAQFQKVIGSGKYSLTGAYTDNFRHTSENNSESIFEVQYSDAKLGGNDGDDATSSEGGQRSQFFGPLGVGYSDGEVRTWVVNEFLKEGTAAGTRDPRLAATVFYNRRQFATALPVDADTLVYGRGYWSRYPDLANRQRVYWRKYQTDYYRNTENFDSPINFRVMRYADVLLLQAEALNEQSRTSDAIPLINQVRERAGLAPLVAGNFNRESLRTQLMHERITELTGEGLRWFDLQRWGLLKDQAGISQLKSRDPDFNNFELNKSRLLPIPQQDIDLSKLQQNPGW